MVKIILMRWLIFSVSQVMHVFFMNIILGCFMKNKPLQSLWSPLLDVTNSSRLDPHVACSTMSSWLKLLFHYHFVISSPMNLWFCVLATLIISAGSWNVGWHKARFSTELSLSSVLIKLPACQLPKKSSENINTQISTQCAFTIPHFPT